MRCVRKALPFGSVDIAKFYDNSSSSQPFSSMALLKNGQLQQQLKPLPDWTK